MEAGLLLSGIIEFFLCISEDGSKERRYLLRSSSEDYRPVAFFIGITPTSLVEML